MITSTDPIADMLSRIRNAIAVRKSSVEMPHSSVKESVARILADNGFIQGIQVEDAKVGKTLTVTINDDQSNARISHIRRLSKPGRRAYVRSAAIPVVRQGRGLVVVSTSRGMMSGIDAKKAGVGGEIICEVY